MGGLAEHIEHALARGRAAWPDLTVEDAAFAARLRECVAEEADPIAALERLAIEDLYLATALAGNDAAALAVLEQKILPDIAPALRTIDPSPAFADEVLQVLRQKLLVEARLARYLGTGPLAGWIRVVALRLGVDQRRQTWREMPLEDELLGMSDPAPDPESLLARERHGEVLREALRHAVLAQTSRTRALLRFYYSEGVGVEELGMLYHVHASTVSRWLAKAREDIYEQTRRRLAETLKIAEREVDTMLGHSLEVSLGGLLKTKPAVEG